MPRHEQVVSGISRDLVSVDNGELGRPGKCSLPTSMPTSVHIKCTHACSTTVEQHSQSDVRVPKVAPEISERYFDVLDPCKKLAGVVAPPHPAKKKLSSHVHHPPPKASPPQPRPILYPKKRKKLDLQGIEPWTTPTVGLA